MTISNETIKKLTVQELNGLGVMNIGVYLYKSHRAKTRVKGFKTTLTTDTETHYESEKVRWEVIRTANKYTTGDNGFAVRRFDKINNKYEEFYPILWGLNFITDNK